MAVVMGWPTILCLGGAFVLSIAWLTSRRKDNLPHRRGWPIVGNLFQLDVKKIHLELTEWSKDLGDIFSVQLAHKHLVIVNSFEAIHEVLVQKGHAFAHRPFGGTFRTNIWTDGYRTPLSMPYGPRYKKIRRMLHSSIKMYDTGLKRIEEINHEMLKDFVKEINAFHGKSFDPEKIVYNTVINVILALLVGKTFKQEEELFKKALRYEDTAMKALSPTGKGTELDSFPWLRFFGNSSYKHLMEAVQLRDQIASMLINESGEESPSVGVLADMKRGLEEEFGGPTEEAMRYLKATTIVGTIIPGTATTSRSTLCFMNVISQLPEIQKRLQEEIDNVVGKERCVLLSDRENMPYTNATLLEVLRFSSVATLGVPHACLEEAEICGKTIPAKSVVVTNLWALHHDESFWNEPFSFKPERFLTDEGEILSPSHPNRRHLMPFGAGHRSCSGEILAKSRLFLIIATLLQKFTLKRGDVTAPMDPRTYKDDAVLKPQRFEIVAEIR